MLILLDSEMTFWDNLPKQPVCGGQGLKAVGDAVRAKVAARAARANPLAGISHISSPLAWEVPWLGRCLTRAELTSPSWSGP